MTWFMVRFTDRSDRLDVRARHGEAHLRWLAEHADRIRLGGPLRARAEGDPVGAMWLVEAEDAEAVKAMIDTDPFWIHGLRERVEILHWRKAVPASPTTI